MVLGFLLKRWGLLTADFCQTASALVYNISLPTLLFLVIVRADLSQLFDLRLLSVALAATLLLFFSLSLSAQRLVAEPRERGIFVQAGFRGNLAVVGLAFCGNAYGEAGLAAASVLMAVLTIAYNLLAVYCLEKSLASKGSPNLLQLLQSVVKNPLILAIVAALLCAYWQLPVPNLLEKSGDYVARLTLPLALLCIGASLSLDSLRQSSQLSFIAVLIKLVVAPLLVTGAVYTAGFRDMTLALAFMLSASPTASVSFIMVTALGGNGRLASNMIALSTLGSVISVSIGITLLKYWQLI